MIPLQQEVDDILFIVSWQIGKGGLEFEAIPNHATVHLFRLWHATVGNHLVKLGYAHAHVSGGFFT